MLAMMEKNIDELTKLMAALSNTTRLIIVCHLINDELCGTQILEKLGSTKGNISQHLKVLLAENIIKKRRDQNRVFFSIKDQRIVNLIKALKKNFCV